MDSKAKGASQTGESSDLAYREGRYTESRLAQSLGAGLHGRLRHPAVEHAAVLLPGFLASVSILFTGFFNL